MIALLACLMLVVPSGIKLLLRAVVASARFRDPSRVELLATTILGGAPPDTFRGAMGYHFPGLVMLSLYAASRSAARRTSAPPEAGLARLNRSASDFRGRIGLFLFQASQRLALTRQEMEEQLQDALLEIRRTGTIWYRVLGWIVVRIYGQRVVLAEKETIFQDGRRIRQFAGTLECREGPALLMVMGRSDELDRSLLQDLFSAEDVTLIKNAQEDEDGTIDLGARGGDGRAADR
ncbi:MAG: hypothetical protein HYV63_17910 [Candidatus Schekmanbacteria bacterium]|nr:hypothetical protein [Candidatus Schekmanbacteria bacterium]